MRIHELSAEECLAVLGRCRIGRLGCARDNQPYVVPVHFSLDGDSLYSFATLGQKITWMRDNPKVCLQVDEIQNRLQWTTVVVVGRYDELLHTPSNEEVRRRARDLFRENPEWWQPAANKLAPNDANMPVIYRIRIEHLSGRRTERDAVDRVTAPWWIDDMFDMQTGRDG